MGRKKDVPIQKPFEEVKLALSGKFASIGYTQGQLEAVVKELGGTTGARIDDSVTHLICTEAEILGALRAAAEVQFT